MLGTAARGFWVARDDDRFGELHDLGIGRLTFKVSSRDSHNTFVAFELVHHAKGGPARHVHADQDEWFYVVEGRYLVEIGDEQFRMNPGDSAFGPRRVPHTWAFVGDGRGRMAFTVTPAGRLEAFLRELSKVGAMAPQDPAFWPPYGMELIGPPIEIERAVEQ